VSSSRIVLDPRAVESLPTGVNLIHIGPQKTGSTAIQGTMHRRRRQLAELGVVYPGPTMRPLAAGAEIGFAMPRGKQAPPPGAWDALVAQVSTPGQRRVCISHEAFGRATPAQVDRIVGELGGGHPHVLAVVRRYDSYLPSQWQQRVKAGELRSYEQWLRVVLEGGPETYAWRNVWMPHDTVDLVRRWGGRVGPENITLLVGDEDDRGLLPDVFERLLALPAGSLRDEGGPRANRSLSYPETELLRATMAYAAEHELPDAMAYRLLHRGLIAALVKSPYPLEEQRIPSLPDWAHDRVVELSAARIAGLRDAGVRILGDLERLRVSPRASGTASIPDAVESVSMVTAQRAVRGLIQGALWEPPPSGTASTLAPDVGLLKRLRRRLSGSSVR
jgi:hypothetical protein